MNRASKLSFFALAPALVMAGAVCADVAETPPALAPVTASAASPELVLQREVRDAVARLIEAGAFGETAPEAIALTVAVPSERVVNVGLLVDSRTDGARGVPLLGTVAGGEAQALGLRAGDVLTSINGEALAGLGRGGDGRARGIERLRGAIDALSDGGTLAVTIERDGRTLELSRTVTPRFMPALRLELGEGELVASNAPAAIARTVGAAATAASDGGCGRISVFHVAPRSQRLYAAKILEIDGEIPGPAGQETYRVAPGPHEVVVAEQISATDLPSTYSRARRHKTKTFTIDVRSDTTYLVASQLNADRQREVMSGAYWDPTVWKEVAEPCH